MIATNRVSELTNKGPFPHGNNGKEAMDIDDNDLGHLSHGLDLDDIQDALPNSTIVLGDHKLVSEDDKMQEDLPYRPAIEVVAATPAQKANIDPGDLELNNDNEGPAVGGGSMARD